MSGSRESCNQPVPNRHCSVVLYCTSAIEHVSTLDISPCKISYIFIIAKTVALSNSHFVFLFLKKPTLLLNVPVQFYDLCELFRTGGQVPDTNYIFMVSEYVFFKSQQNFYTTIMLLVRLYFFLSSRVNLHVDFRK